MAQNAAMQENQAPEAGASIKDLVADLKEKLEKIAQGGGEKYRTRHVERGKLLPRLRVSAWCRPTALPWR